ncbi:hypothetical protein A3J56_01000 [Candidatus Giovannonibacteria bacterium RIFCSPHIGHO2_02_FULL_46_20]|uniref:Uncharacterized protein n=1 Tax=Candidatus Giovannonibacteria bacterium RIFCSPHIGHO2_02_FULL_46_20 TaxID=1798338 RepID=A0A1F5WFK3_9BACT|nr:MAG: hypothetical protein A3J56_01000 [Candidatus Giovannonibacteria bacterium RIFCSPHIGHO2_02_FULL_46_20]
MFLTYIILDRYLRGDIFIRTKKFPCDFCILKILIYGNDACGTPMRRAPRLWLFHMIFWFGIARLRILKTQK